MRGARTRVQCVSHASRASRAVHARACRRQTSRPQSAAWPQRGEDEAWRGMANKNCRRKFDTPAMR
eukprot:194068-Chlamydomonas_euryale.AAC.3